MKPSSEKYRTIKSLVFDLVHRTCGNVQYVVLTSEVRKHFPTSRWQETHWAWYRYQIAKGRFSGEFSDEERKNLYPDTVELPRIVGVPRAGSVPQAESRKPNTRGPAARDQGVKRIGDPILEQTRLAVTAAAAGDQDLLFKLNRWVFSRLLQDEIRVKKPIKKSLWEKGMTECQACGETFESLKAVEIHRKDSSHTYSVENCELLCRECHQELA